MLLTRAALASGIIYPLYVWPGENCEAWTPLISAVTSHPNLPWYIIVNPNSGPGAVNSQPDAAYQKCVPKLKSTGNPNVKLLGYVRTDYTKIPTTTVQNEVATYAKWNSAYSVNGIFFDEVDGSSAAQSRYSTYTSYAKSQISNAFVSLNPGAYAEPGFYTFADQVVSAEKYFNEFSPSVYTISPSTPASKQAVILTDSPSTLPSSTVTQIIKTDKIGAVYITNDTQVNFQNPYDNFPTYWTGFVNAVQTAAS